MSDNTGYASVINLAMSLGSSLMFVTSRPAASSISDATANPVTATGAFTTGGPVLSPPDGAAGGYVSNAASVVPWVRAVSYTHLRAHETGRNLVCRLLLEK